MDASSHKRPRDPFSNLQGLSDRKPLTEVIGRRQCPFCGSSAKFFCYECCVVLGVDSDKQRLPPALPVAPRPGFAKAEVATRAKFVQGRKSVLALNTVNAQHEQQEQEQEQGERVIPVPVIESIGPVDIPAERRRERPGGVPLITDLGAGVRLDVVHHYLEGRGKSTAIHSKVLAPDCVRFFDYPDFPDYRTRESASENRSIGAIKNSSDSYPTPGSVVQPLPSSSSSASAAIDAVAAAVACRATGSTVLVFPKAGSRCVAEMSDSEIDAISSVVVVDSTWEQAKQIMSDPRLSELPCIRLGDQYQTEFWRYQDKGEDHLATIEAIYWVLRELWERRAAGATLPAYTGQLDNLLYYFRHFFELVQEAHRKNPTKRSKLRAKKSQDYLRT